MVFCRDGVLRTRERHRGSGVDVDMPLRTVEKFRPDAFLAHVSQEVELEDGLTVRELLENLEPWSRQVGAMAEMDFAAFLAEARLPPSPDPDFARLEIFHGLQFEAPDRCGRPDQSATAGSSQEARLPRVAEGWSCLGVLKTPRVENPGTDIEHTVRACSVDYMPLERWAHLPVVISKRTAVRDDTAAAGRSLPSTPLSRGETVLNPDHPSRKPSPAGATSRARRVVEVELEAPWPSFMAAIVRGFLFEVGLDWTPAARDTRMDGLALVVADLEDALAEGRIGDAADSVLFASGAGQRPGETAPGDVESADPRADAGGGEPHPDDDGVERMIALCRLEDPLRDRAVRGMDAGAVERIIDRLSAQGGHGGDAA